MKQLIPMLNSLTKTLKDVKLLDLLRPVLKFKSWLNSVLILLRVELSITIN
jgi:hypothetical protein